MSKLFETTKYETKSDGSVFSYSSFESSNNGTIGILESFNEGEVVSWVLAGPVKDLCESLGESEFLALLRSQASEETNLEMNSSGLSLAEIKKHIIDRAESEGHRFNEHDYEDGMEYLTELFKPYSSPFFFCTVENFGWRKQSGHKFVKIETGTDFVQKVLPDTDNSFSIFEEENDVLKVVNAHHDSPMGESYYLQNMTLSVMIDLYSSGYDIDEILEHSTFSELEKEGHERFILIAIEKNDSSAIGSLLQYGVSLETEQGYKSMIESAFDIDAVDALDSFLSKASLAINEKIIKAALSRTNNEEMIALIKQHIG